jgi:hypothetical protein
VTPLGRFVGDDGTAVTSVMVAGGAMRCEEAWEWLEGAEAGWAQDAAPEVAAARRHLAECAACRVTAPQRTAWSTALRGLMPQVAVPDKLRERLLADLPVVTPAPPAPITSRRRFGRHWWLASAALGLIFAVLLTRWPSPPVTHTLAELAPAGTIEFAELTDFRDGFEPRLPVSWAQTFALSRELIRGYPPTGAAPGSIAVIPFQWIVRPGVDPLRGRLVILPRVEFDVAGSRLPAQALDKDFAHGQPLYLADGTALVIWQEAELVYLCLMPSGPRDLEQFQRALSGPRSMT